MRAKLYDVLDTNTGELIGERLRCREVSDLIDVDLDHISQYARRGSRCKRRYVIIPCGEVAAEHPPKEMLLKEWDGGKKADPGSQKKRGGRMLAYGVKDLTTGEDICRKATRQQVADLIGAPAGKVPSMAKAGRLHEDRYLIYVEGELEDLVDEEFREDWDETREFVMQGLKKAQRREHGIDIG